MEITNKISDNSQKFQTYDMRYNHQKNIPLGRKMIFFLGWAQSQYKCTLDQKFGTHQNAWLLAPSTLEKWHTEGQGRNRSGFPCSEYL